MTTIQIRAFLEAQHEAVHDVLAQGPRNGSHLLPDGFLQDGDGPGLPEYTRIEICTRPVKFARENVSLKECTELNGGHLEHIALEYTKTG